MTMVYYAFYCAFFVLINVVAGLPGKKSVVLSKKLKIGRLLDDVPITFGQIFNFSLPRDAFIGHVDSYEILDAGTGGPLPEWIIWNAESFSFLGIPRGLRQLVIPETHISITAINKYGARVQQVFTVKVVQNSKYSIKNTLKSAKEDGTCSLDGNRSLILIAFLPVDVDGVMNQINVVKSASSLLNADLAQFRLVESRYLMKLDGFSSEIRLTKERSIAMLLILGCGNAENAQTLAKANKALARTSADLRALTNFRNAHSILFQSRLQVGLRSRLPREAQSFEAKNDDDEQYVESLFDQSKSHTEEIDEEAFTDAPVTTRHSSPLFVNQSPFGRRTTRRRPDVSTNSVYLYPVTSPTRTSRITASPSRYVPHFSSSGRFSAEKSNSDYDSQFTVRSTKILPRFRYTTIPYDSSPVLRYNLGTIECTAHILCEKRIHPYSFEDEQDGNASKLTLKLITIKAPRNSEKWFVLDSSKLELVGIPMQSGTWEFELIAYDKAGNPTSDAFDVVVKSGFLDSLPPSHSFSIGLRLPYDQFMRQPMDRVKFVRRLAKHLGDSTSNNVRLNGIERYSKNSSLLLLNWSNTSLLVDDKELVDCKNNQVDAIFKSQLTDIFRDRMNAKVFPFFNVLRSYDKRCDKLTAGMEKSKTTRVLTTSGGSGSSNLFLATVLPAIIVLALICLAAVLACYMYRKNKRIKKSSVTTTNGRPEPHENGRTFFAANGKGAPVIFPDEILDASGRTIDEDDEKSGTKVPMLLKDEKPPQSPPDFTTPLVSSGTQNATYYPAGYQSPLSSSKLNGNGRRAASLRRDDTELMATRPLLAGASENPLYRSPPPPYDPAAAIGRSAMAVRSPASVQRQTTSSQPPFIPP